MKPKNKLKKRKSTVFDINEQKKDKNNKGMGQARLKQCLIFCSEQKSPKQS